MSGKFFLKAPIIYTRVWIATSKDPKYIPPNNQQKTITLIEKFAQKLGWDTSLSDRVTFTRENIKIVPQQSGVYRIYAGEELKYIGKAKNLRRRLTGYLSSCHNENLANLIASNESFMEWYVCPMSGWMECYEHTKYIEKHGRLPEFNRIRGGDLWN